MLLNGVERWQTIYQVQDSYAGRKQISQMGQVGRGMHVQITKKYGGKASSVI